MGISRRFPGWPATISVYAIVVLFVYGWTAYWFLWEFSSWLYYLSVSEMLVIVSYSAVVNLLESLALTAGMLLLCFLLPKDWFSDRFTSAGSLFTILLGGFLIRFSEQMQHFSSFSYTLLIEAGVFLFAAICAALLLCRFRPFANLLETFAERSRIFLYITIPISILSLFVVLERNLA